MKDSLRTMKKTGKTKLQHFFSVLAFNKSLSSSDSAIQTSVCFACKMDLRGDVSQEATRVADAACLTEARLSPGDQ